MAAGIGLDGWQCRCAAAIALAAAFAFVVLSMLLPVAIFAGAGHDDAWFWHRAQSIVSGDWLGDYDQFTLMKGVGYPMFLALNHALGTPVSFLQALLYAAACLLVGHGVYRITGRPWIALGLVLLLQWHPMGMTWERIVRDNIYAAQTLLVVGCLLQSLFVARSSWGKVAWAALSGWTLAWLWSTREDGVWMLPGLIVLLAASLLHARRTAGGSRVFIACGLAMALFFGILSGLIATANWVKYGRFETVDLKGAAFSGALSALQSVRGEERIPYVPVPASAREKAYAASPTFARLQPYLEGAGRHWTEPGCKLYAQACGDYAGGWFLWAFRDAVASVGGYESARSAHGHYQAIAAELEGACNSGALDCGGAGFGFMPPVSHGQWRTLPARLYRGAMLAAWRNASLPEYRSHGGKGMIGEMWRFVGGPKNRDGARLAGRYAGGWFYDPYDAWIRIRCASTGYVRGVERRRSPDIAAHFGDAAADRRRFEFDVPPGPDCMLEAGSGDDYAPVVDMDGLMDRPGSLSVGSATLYFDHVGEGIDAGAGAPASALAIRQVVHRAYQAFLPWLAGAGLLAFLWTAAQALLRRRFTPLLALATAGWVLVVSRIVLLSLVDMSSFPALNVQYMQPAFPLLVLAVATSLACIGIRCGGAGEPYVG